MSPARGVQNAQIWMAGVVIGIEPATAPNGGSVCGALDEADYPA